MINNMQVEGFVISITKYKESGSIVNLLTKEGIVTFNAHGSLKINSPSAIICQLYNKVKIELSESSKSGYKTLKEGIVISNFTKIYDNLEAILTLSFVVDLCKKVAQTGDNISSIYDLLDLTFNAVLNEIPLGLIRVAFMAQLIILSGLRINVSECVRCGSKKKILSLSYRDGGFICQNCFQNEDIVMSTTYIKLVRYLFIAEYKEILTKNLPMPDCYQLFIDLYKFFVDEIGISSKSYKLLQKASFL